MTSGVYAIINTADGRAYVGSAFDIERRWQGHRWALKRSSPQAPRSLLAAWRTAGGVGFDWRVLEEIAPDDGLLVQAEQRWLDHFGSLAYNAAGPVARREHHRPVRSGWRPGGDPPKPSRQRRHSSAPGDRGTEGE